MERLKLVTLNIWNRQGPWEQRLPLIRRGLQALDADLIGLQEVLAADNGASQANEIVEGTDYHVVYWSAWEVGKGLHFGNALLSRFPIQEQKTFVLPVAHGDESRCLGFARVEGPDGSIPVFVTHLSWKLHQCHIRARQVREIADQIHHLAPVNGFPPILMGDMNAEPGSDEMRFFRGETALGGRGVYLADCWGACNRDLPEPGYTYARGNSYAFRTREPSRRIDYIYVRGPDRQLRGEPLSCRVVLAEAEEDIYPSDHFGVYAEISSAPRRADGI